ncbi:hypothetical protein Tco_1218185 [Tanacetum coccineum]
MHDEARKYSHEAIVVRSLVSNSGLKDIHQGVIHQRKYSQRVNSSVSLFIIEPSACILFNNGDNPTVEQVMLRAKCVNDDYVCRGLILNGMSDPLFDIFQNVESSKELWDSLEAKYTAKDASSKKFLVSNFTNYNMTDSRPVMEQYNELFIILGRFTQQRYNVNFCLHLR